MKTFMIVMLVIVGFVAYRAGHISGVEAVKRQLTDIEKICALDTCFGLASAEDMALKIKNIRDH